MFLVKVSIVPCGFSVSFSPPGGSHHCGLKYSYFSSESLSVLWSVSRPSLQWATFLRLQARPASLLSVWWPAPTGSDACVVQSQTRVVETLQSAGAGRDQRYVCPHVHPSWAGPVRGWGARLTCTLQKFICCVCVDATGTRKFCYTGRIRGDATSAPWIRRVTSDQKICPFAPRPFSNISTWNHSRNWFVPRLFVWEFAPAT